MAWADMTDEEREAWTARKDAGRASAYQAWIGTATMLAENPELIDGFRLACARIRPYSIGNCLRVFGQREAFRVDARFFWGRYGRQVLPDATPIWILAPKAEGKRTKEVTNKETGETETVEEAYKIWPVEDVYAAVDTTPKDRSCLFCGTQPGQRCNVDCPVLQPVSGPIPSREDVADALHTALKKVGGFDPMLLDDLDPDPYPDGSWSEGVTWGNLTVEKSAANGKTPKKRRYQYLHRADLETGRVRYAIAGFGVIWIGPDDYSYPRGSDGLRIQYGDDAADYRVRDGQAEAPHAPIMNGVTLGSYAVVSPEKRGHNHRFWLNVWRVGSYRHRAPDTTSDQVAQIVRQLIDHYLALPERDEVEAAHARLRAPQRAAAHEEKAAGLREQLATLQAELAAEETAAAEQAALVTGGTNE